MTPKEKALELVEKYKLLDYNSNLSIEKLLNKKIV